MNNFALYNAPPGTMQRMPVYFYLSPRDSRATQQAVMAFTHDDVYAPIPGFKVLVSHFHFHFNDSFPMPVRSTWSLAGCRCSGRLESTSRYSPTSSGDGHPEDTGKARLDEQKVYFEGCERFSDRDFLLFPGEEPDANFGDTTCSCSRSRSSSRMSSSPIEALSSRFRKLSRSMERSITPQAQKQNWTC